ncbi:MAG: agmatinase [Firmicutes bacterium]|nr:agmatinase [Alicyclobacillaceae bacterium]MCL6496177.1 agmatinase [Bacillota bacterium]
MPEGFTRQDRFLGMEATYAEAEWVLMGVPFDTTASFQPGSRFGPPRIREASFALETYSLAAACDLTELSLCDLGDLELPFGNVAKSLDRIRQAAEGLLADGKRFVAVGGEHLITLPLVQAVVARYPDLVVVHWDAHADLRDQYLGETLSHATVLRRVAETLRAGHLYQFGIRSATREEVDWACRHHHFFPHEVRRPLEACRPEWQGRPLYVTIDVDVIDPAFMPGTGTPEPGGITAQEALAALASFRGLDVVALDVVETMPAHDLSQRSSILAAKLVREALAWIAGGTPKEGGARG